jgi:hypothetical protein
VSDRAKRRHLFLGGVLGAAAALTAVVGLGVLAATGSAASAEKPRNTSPPTVTGTPQEGQTLTGRRGEWTNRPTDFNFFWMRCDKTGGSCANISGATAATYRLTSADVGDTIRFKVEATNADGSTNATSVPSAVIAAATQPPPASGCPAGNGPVSVSSVNLPARLLVDQMQFSPSVVRRETQHVIARFHVSNTCGQAVQGALVYVTAVPFGQLSVPNEQPTDQGGWAEVDLRTLAGFPVSPRQQLIAMFVRARKPGGNLLAGISTRRLVSLRADVR